MLQGPIWHTKYLARVMMGTTYTTICVILIYAKEGATFRKWSPVTWWVRTSWNFHRLTCPSSNPTKINLDDIEPYRDNQLEMGLVIRRWIPRQLYRCLGDKVHKIKHTFPETTYWFLDLEVQQGHVYFQPRLSRFPHIPQIRCNCDQWKWVPKLRWNLGIEYVWLYPDG
jgi:hypothetical protein